MTLDAANDVLDQEGVNTRLLLVANDCTDETLRIMEGYCRGSERVLLWNHRPALPALGATWNRALEFCWESGASEVLVANNDLKLAPKTYSLLLEAMRAENALFVSAVNSGGIPDPYVWDLKAKGGPDFSCFLISNECHQRYPFDSELTYSGDCDTHRRIMLGGEGDRIFSVNVPYNHLGSQTVKSKPHLHEVANQHREYYKRKWGGGGVNQEAFREPFSGLTEEGITNPELFNKIRASW
jgi:hypothetical protein